MNFIEASIFILTFATLSVPIASRFHLPLEIFLVIGSCLISLIPGITIFKINPLIIFEIFLPPILFYAAYFTSWRDFKFNFRPISLLAVGLVLFTAAMVAIVSKYLIGLSWALSFLLGAVVSPTDASSSTAIIKKLGAPRRLIAVIEGESLVNDATALVLFRFILAAILVGSFSMTEAISKFFVVAAGGIVIGLCIAYVSSWLQKQLHHSYAETTLTILTAFICYLVAEHFHVSGVIATVVGGIYTGIHFPEYSSTQTRINAKASWTTLVFVINAFAFALIGLQLPVLLKNLELPVIFELIKYGILITIILIVVRIAWVFPMAYLPRFFFPSIARKDPVPPWQGLFIVSWAGMRGIVSLAAALSIPYELHSGLPFPERDALIFITYCVIVATLVIPSLTLPWLLKHFKLDEAEIKMKEESIARIYTLKAALKEIKAFAEKEKIADELYKKVRDELEMQLNVVQTQLEPKPYSTLTNDFVQLKKITIVAINSQREALMYLRKSGEIHDEVFHQISFELDLEEMRTKGLRI